MNVLVLCKCECITTITTINNENNLFHYFVIYITSIKNIECILCSLFKDSTTPVKLVENNNGSNINYNLSR
jgi:hypothetical protein